MLHLIWMFIVGIVVGAIARWIMPGAESMGESFTRYVTQVFRQSFFFRFINQTNAQASTNFILP